MAEKIEVVIRYSKAESEKFYKKLKRIDTKKLPEYIDSYAVSDNVNKRVAAAHFRQSFDLLINDSDIHVLKTLAEFSPKVDLKTTRLLLKHESIDVRSAAAVALAKCGALTLDELSVLDIPIIRTLISRRLYLMEIAQIHKHGEIKICLNDELNVMSRRDGIEVKEIRDALNAHPFRQGDYSYEVIDSLDEDYMPNTPRDFIEEIENAKDDAAVIPSDKTAPGDDLLTSLLD